MQIVPVIIGITSVLSLLAFALYIVGLIGLPTGRRPKTPTWNRYGEPLPPTENPGFEETEDEHE